MSTKRNKAVLDWCPFVSHPEILIVSKSPVKLQGFLIISYSDCKQDTHCPRIKIKLVVPNYPLIQDAQISFGKQIAVLRNTNFSKNVKKLIKSPIPVHHFLTQLQLLIGKCMCNTDTQTHKIDLSISDLLQDIKTALLNQSDVRISCNKNLNVIKLFLRDISLTLQRRDNTEIPWEVISSNLPTTSMLECYKHINNLSVAINKFKWQIELLENAWKQLKEIDENCWVIDPVEPNKSHMYRRIHLSQSISMTITINPLQLISLPTIKFSGSDSEVKKQTEYISKNIHNWNPDCSVLENIKVLLNMYTFPEQQESLENDSVDNRECGICFYMKLDPEELPDKICNNTKCMKQFHSVCLSKWLQTRPGNQVAFNYIYGACPYCKEMISCSLT